MALTLSAKGVCTFLRSAAKLMNESRAELCALDSQAGDGDLGLTMSRGFSAVADSLEDSADPSDLFKSAAMTMMNTVPSTMGTLVGSGLLRVSTLLRTAGTADPLVSTILDGLIAGIEARGKAKQGDKTILDSLHAARSALTLEADDSEAMFAAAARAVTESAKLPAVHGRAARAADKAVGKIDPGARAGAIIVRALAIGSGNS